MSRFWDRWLECALSGVNYLQGGGTIYLGWGVADWLVAGGIGGRWPSFRCSPVGVGKSRLFPRVSPGARIMPSRWEVVLGWLKPGPYTGQVWGWVRGFGGRGGWWRWGELSGRWSNRRGLGGGWRRRGGLIRGRIRGNSGSCEIQFEWNLVRVVFVCEYSDEMSYR